MEMDLATTTFIGKVKRLIDVQVDTAIERPVIDGIQYYGDVIELSPGLVTFRRHDGLWEPYTCLEGLSEVWDSMNPRVDSW